MHSQEIKKTKCKLSNFSFKIYSLIKFHFSYVQHLISKEKSRLSNMIKNRGGYFYISGSSKNMPLAVKEALEEAIDNKDFVAEMIKSGKFQEETWS